MLKLSRRAICGLVASALLLCACDDSPEPGTVKDEATLAGRDTASFAAADEDYFHDMDGGIALTPEQVKGRNIWMVWTGGNDRFWDALTRSRASAPSIC